MIIPPYVETQPVYQHDCEKCTYLGATTVSVKEWDVYFCGGLLGDTLILRYGDNGSAYETYTVKYTRNLVDYDLLTRELLSKALEMYDTHENYCEGLAYDMYAI